MFALIRHGIFALNDEVIFLAIGLAFTLVVGLSWLASRRPQLAYKKRTVNRADQEKLRIE